MNCPNCSGPMELVEKRDYFHCPYCSCIAFPNDSDASADGVVAFDSQADHDCPVCRVRLVDGTLDGVRLLTCTKCRGILLPNDDFRILMRRRRAEREGPPREPEPLDRGALQRSIQCPSCQRAMETHPYYGPGNVVIDSCGRCKLLWLDHAEFARVESAPGATW